MASQKRRTSGKASWQVYECATINIKPCALCRSSRIAGCPALWQRAPGHEGVEVAVLAMVDYVLDLGEQKALATDLPLSSMYTTILIPAHCGDMDAATKHFGRMQASKMATVANV
jgi:uncharacterized protein YceK